MDKPVILTVEDDDDLRFLITNFLNMTYECEAKEARDGKEAVAFVKSNPCDVIILDIKLPKKSGLAVIKEAKKINPDADILVVSGWASDDVAEETLKLGATDYLVKSDDFKAMTIKLNGILDKRRQRLNKI